MEINTGGGFLWLLRGNFVRIYQIELRDQEFLVRFVSIDILWALGLHAVIKTNDCLSLPLPRLFLRVLPHPRDRCTRTHAGNPAR